MNKSESKYFNTSIKMDLAFLELLEKKDFSYITIKEICEKAGVNRSTFYLHYETIGDLLSESIQYVYAQFLTYMKTENEEIVEQLRECPLEKLYLITPRYLTLYLNYIKEHKRLFQTAVKNSLVLQLGDTYDRMFCHVFTPILERYQVPKEDRSYIMAFFVNGLMAVITEWLKQDCADTVDHIADVMMNCVMKHQN